nr:type II secretion system protein GspL [Pseudomonadota bacterium]
MNQTLIFRFAAPDQVEWLRPGGAPEAGSLADLAARAGGLRPVLTAPAEAVLLTSARLPGRQRGTWLKAVPFALEDNLAEDVEDLHFAVGAPPPGGEVPVAVVRHDDLRGWLSACAGAGVAPAAV